MVKMYLKRQRTKNATYYYLRGKTYEKKAVNEIYGGTAKFRHIAQLGNEDDADLVFELFVEVLYRNFDKLDEEAKKFTLMIPALHLFASGLGSYAAQRRGIDPDEFRERCNKNFLRKRFRKLISKYKIENLKAILPPSPRKLEKEDKEGFKPPITRIDR